MNVNNIRLEGQEQNNALMAIVLAGIDILVLTASYKKKLLSSTALITL
jgi:hypothetical protein